MIRSARLTVPGPGNDPDDPTTPTPATEATFVLNLDEATGGLPRVDLDRTTIGFHEVVARLRDGTLGSTELPAEPGEGGPG